MAVNLIWLAGVLEDIADEFIPALRMKDYETAELAAHRYIDAVRKNGLDTRAVLDDRPELSYAFSAALALTDIMEITRNATGINNFWHKE